MASNCTDSSNEQYKLYWFDYFVSIGYIDNSALINPYAPYGKCTRSLLWLTYLINIVHFFLLSSGILYLLNHHQNQSGFWWPFVNWISSFVLIVGSIILFVFLNFNVRWFTILIIAVQLSTLIILWISIFIVIVCTFNIEYRYQRCLYLFIIILFIIQTCCFVAQVVITLHCVFNLKLMTSFLDYGYWSAIIAAVGTIISTLLLDYIFIWCGKRRISSRVNPAPVNPQNENVNRATSPVDSVILEDFHDQPEAASHQVYNNNNGTRRFRIQPTNQRSNDQRPTVPKNDNLGAERNAHSLRTTSEA